jgi:hypothetical protein
MEVLYQPGQNFLPYMGKRTHPGCMKGGADLGEISSQTVIAISNHYVSITSIKQPERRSGKG